MIVYIVDRNARPDMFGLIPSFLKEDDPRPAREQFDERYVDGRGWHPIQNFKMDRDGTLHYPGDPPLPVLAFMKLRQESILFYRHAMVAIMQPDGDFTVARMD